MKSVREAAEAVWQEVSKRHDEKDALKWIVPWGKLNDLRAALDAEKQAAQPSKVCLGYPDCDAMLTAEPHERNCPVYKPTEAKHE